MPVALDPSDHSEERFYQDLNIEVIASYAVPCPLSKYDASHSHQLSTFAPIPIFVGPRKACPIAEQIKEVEPVPEI
jgi:hypothetical protein